MDINNLLRTYLHVNNDKYRGMTYKFAAFAIIAALALGVSYWAGSVREEAQGGPAMAAGHGASDAGGGDAAAPEALAQYVGYNPDTFGGAATYDPVVVQAALDEWYAANPGAAVTLEPVTQDGLLIGYWLHPK